MCENEHHEWHVDLSGRLIYLGGGDIVHITNSEMTNVNKLVMVICEARCTVIV